MENQSRPIALSRSVVLTEESSIPSLLLLGKLVSDGFPAASASVLPDKLREIWDPSGTVNFWPVTDGTFLVQFYEAEDLTKAHEGAPWSCGDGDEGRALFFMQHVKQGMNMVDQIAGFTKAELWVRFNSVPVDHFSATSVYALAAGIGEPVNCDLSHTSSADFLRARIRVDITRPLECSVDVVLENGHQASVSVEYEGVLPSLCSSCRILGHPADRCPRKAHQPAAAAATAAASRPAVYTPTPSHLGPGRSTSSSLRGKSSRRYEVVFANAPASPAPPPTPPTPPTLRRSGQEPLSPVNSSCFNFFNLKSWRKGVGKNKSFSTLDDSQHETEPSNQEAQVLETNSPMERVQEPSVMETHETQLDTTPITHSYSIVKAQGSRSRNHARIEIMVETHCSPQFIMGAMQWLSKKDVITGLDAAYDGKRGVISIYGLQIDQNTDPVDLVAYLLPKIRTKSGLAETQTKPDSPARFADTMMRFHDAHCCKGASN
ncbi:hypothetical protein QYE76_058365 [Lolium multiflorum]|uniref:DUF4283 domain-containing protein n=1 Tax=Lolium multiflorum TaxID=4521 RepID=A0AAD8T6R7_LOLMU|nr:hypothetical protein QYE76_058365 [Lolium multiflorum]